MLFLGDIFNMSKNVFFFLVKVIFDKRKVCRLFYFLSRKKFLKISDFYPLFLQSVIWRSFSTLFSVYNFFLNGEVLSFLVKMFHFFPDFGDKFTLFPSGLVKAKFIYFFANIFYFCPQFGERCQLFSK